ncbi:MAG: NAD(P)H-dependent oxidoreductase subunit E, partial [Rhodocyclaceae bacterium]|nr:NAD(P)H-dependent oxidoreductase subunit E [Rhodocyclaceae bacterium]
MKRGSRRSRPGERPPSAAARAAAARAIGQGPVRRDMLIEYLHRLQDAEGCLPAEHLEALAEAMGLAPVEVFEVASFYHHFDVVREGEAPPPATTVRVCDSLTCSLFGAETLAEKLQAFLGPGVRVQRVPCVGRCDTAPVAVAGERPVPRATPEEVAEVVAGGDLAAPAPGGIGFEAYVAAGGYRLLRDCLDGRRDPAGILAALDHAGLRGLGGAGFPSARKWRTVMAQPAPRYLAVNVDEGEPGTFKDRHLLETDPHRFVEGMLVA